MLSSIQNQAATAGYSFLRYTPFVPAVKKTDSGWEIDRSLLYKRVYVIRAIALTVFAASMAFEVLSIATISCIVLIISCQQREIFTGFYSSFKFFIDKQSETCGFLEYAKTLIKFHVLLSENEFIKHFEILKNKTNPVQNWVDIIVENIEQISSNDIELTTQFFKRLFNLKLFKQADYLNCLQKLQSFPSSREKNAFLYNLIKWANFPHSDEEESIVFQKLSCTFNSPIVAYLKKHKARAPALIAQYFPKILQEHPNEARRLVYLVAHWSRSATAPLDVEKWMHVFIERNPGHPLKQQFQETLELVRDSNDVRLLGMICSLSQQEATESFQNNSGKVAGLEQRAQFEDAFVQAILG